MMRSPQPVRATDIAVCEIAPIRSRARRRPAAHDQAGLTLTELLVASAVGLSLLLAAVTLLVSMKNAYLQADDSARIDDTGRYALETIGRAIRQAGHVPRDSAAPPVEIGTRLAGLDNSALAAGSATWDSGAATAAVNGSDAFVTRFFGAGSGVADGAISNCAGVAIAAPASAAAMPAGSAFYVADSSDGEPELRCKFLTAAGSWAASQIARGVESFQVLYGIDDNGDRVPERFVSARHVAPTQWPRVAAVRVGLLVRGAHRGSLATPATIFHLFGPHYSSAVSDDTGVQLPMSRLRDPARQRRLFQRTFWLSRQDLP